MSNRILIIEDDPDAKRLLELLFSTEGHRTIACKSAAQALEALDESPPDLVIIDMTLPDMEGLELTRRIRSNEASARVPIFAVTGRMHQADKYEAFMAGADDFISKPFDPMELIFRVRAALRRTTHAPPIVGTIEVGVVRLESACYMATVKGRDVSLTKLETKLLHHLMTHPGVVFSSDQLSLVLSEDRESPRTRDAAHAHVRHLRQKLEADPANPEILVTVGRKGYAFANSQRS